MGKFSLGSAERRPTKDLRERNLIGRDSVEPRMFDSALIGAALPSRPRAIRVNRPYLSMRCSGGCVNADTIKKGARRGERLYNRSGFSRVFPGHRPHVGNVPA
jgi:hypothetical protein